MELILDSSNIEQIKDLNELLHVSGVTTNPTIITKSGRSFEDVVNDLIAVLDEEQMLFIQAVSTDVAGIVEEAKYIASLQRKTCT